MSCPRHSRLVACARGDLPPAESSRIHEHAAGCPDCRSSLEDVQRVLRDLRTEAGALRGEAYPGDVVDDLRGRVRMAGPPRERGPAGRWERWGGLAAAAALAVTLVVVARRPAPSRPGRGPSLSPFQTVVGLPASGGPVPRTLSPPPPRIGAATSLGASALTRLRPLSRPEVVNENRRSR